MNLRGIITNRGQWDFPGQITTIPSNNITMRGVPYPVLGISNTGHSILMQPNKNYKFKGKYVTEYPLLQQGGMLEPYIIENEGLPSEDLLSLPSSKRGFGRIPNAKNLTNLELPNIESYVPSFIRPQHSFQNPTFGNYGPPPRTPELMDRMQMIPYPRESYGTSMIGSKFNFQAPSLPKPILKSSHNPIRRTKKPVKRNLPPSPLGSNIELVQQDFDPGQYQTGQGVIYNENGDIIRTEKLINVKQTGGSFKDKLLQRNSPIIDNSNIVINDPRIQQEVLNLEQKRQQDKYSTQLSQGNKTSNPYKQRQSFQLNQAYLNQHPYAKLNEEGQLEPKYVDRNMQGVAHPHTSASKVDQGLNTFAHGLDGALLLTGAYDIGRAGIQGLKSFLRPKTFSQGSPYELAPHIYQDMYPSNGIYQPRTVITDGAVKNEILGLEPTPLVPIPPPRYETKEIPSFLQRKHSNFGSMEAGKYPRVPKVNTTQEDIWKKMGLSLPPRRVNTPLNINSLSPASKNLQEMQKLELARDNKKLKETFDRVRLFNENKNNEVWVDRNLRDLISEKDFRTIGEENEGLLGLFTNNFKKSSDEVNELLSGYTPYNKFSNYTPDQLQSAMNQADETIYLSNILGKPKVNLGHKTQKNVARNTINRLNEKEQIVNNNDWFNTSNWKEFGMEMRGNMKSRNLDYSNQSDVEKYRKILLNEILQKAIGTRANKVALQTNLGLNRFGGKLKIK